MLAVFALTDYLGVGFTAFFNESSVHAQPFLLIPSHR